MRRRRSRAAHTPRSNTPAATDEHVGRPGSRPDGVAWVSKTPLSQPSDPILKPSRDGPALEYVLLELHLVEAVLDQAIVRGTGAGYSSGLTTMNTTTAATPTSTHDRS